MVLPIRLYLLICLLHGCCSGSSSQSPDSCPAAVRGLHYFSHQLREFHCPFIWTNREEMIEKVRDRMKYRQKQFLRFKVPVYYLDRAWNWKQASHEVETWVWVAHTHEYMLHFPHNFNVLSLGTMGIITNDFWEPDGEGDIFGYCDKKCVNRKMMKPRCTLSWKDIQKFMFDVTEENKVEWNHVCFQLDYDVSDVIGNPNSAIPDLLYYCRFLRQLFSKRPYLGKGVSKNDFSHYRCHDRKGQLEDKELLMNYFVILIIAMVLWFYSPLLVYYFPSSKPITIHYPQGLNRKDFCPTYRSPVYFANFLRCILCFYMEENKGFKSRVRRLAFVSCSFAIAIRLLYTPYHKYFVLLLLTFLTAGLVPEFLSVSIRHELPTHFMGLWKYPEGVFRENTRKEEYQFLAHCMQERIYLVSDLRFWEMLVRESFKAPLFSNTWTELYTSLPLSLFKLILSVIVSVITFLYAVLVTVVYYLAPAFYFYKELFLAIYTGTKRNVLGAWRGVPRCFGYNAFMSAICFTHGVILAALLVYFIMAAMFCCYLLAEVTMFTYIGAVLVPSMAFRYLALVGSIALVLYKIAKDLRENYDKLQDQVVEILESPDHLTQLNAVCSTSFPGTLERQEDPNGTLTVVLKNDPQPPTHLLYRDHFTTYLSRKLLDFCIDICDPLRRQMMFIIAEVFLMAFYVLIAMYIKNVFHKEQEVSSIFTIAQTIGMYFVPSLLQFLAHKSHFGKKDDVLLHRRVHEVMATYVTKH